MPDEATDLLFQQQSTTNATNMTPAQPTRTFEYDDYPLGKEHLLRLLDDWHERYPGFRANLFAIPALMAQDQDAWDQVHQRADWVRIYPHGFQHGKRECRLDHGRTRHKWTWVNEQLEAIRLDRRWGRVFKAPWYAHDGQFIEQLHKRGFAFCTKSLSRLPLPLSSKWRMWSINDAQFAAQLLSPRRWQGWHVEAHPIYEDRYRYNKAKKTEPSERNLRRWTRGWRPEHQWGFIEDMTRPAALMINLGCGTQHHSGWTGFDPRAEQLGNGAIAWSWDQQLPYGPNKADAVVTSHTFNYLEEDRYEEALLEIWRVLRPGGVLRMAQDRTDSGYVWRRPGQRARGTGEIKSLPTQQRILEALQRVGFVYRLTAPGQTLSHHQSILHADTREKRWQKGHKFYVEAIKVQHHRYDVSRYRGKEPRATLKGRWRMPPLAPELET